MKMVRLTKAALFLAPLVSGYTTLAIVGGSRKLKTAGSNVLFRPSPRFFGLIWPVLYIGLGDAMASCYAKPTEPLGALVCTNILLNSWVLTYCLNNKKESIYTLIPAMALCQYAAITTSRSRTRGELVAMNSWLGFALLMNITEVQYS